MYMVKNLEDIYQSHSRPIYFPTYLPPKRVIVLPDASPCGAGVYPDMELWNINSKCFRKGYIVLCVCPWSFTKVFGKILGVILFNGEVGGQSINVVPRGITR